MTIEKIQEFADKNDFGKVVKSFPWNGYECYEPYVEEGEEMAKTGEPMVILVKGEAIRFSTWKESFARLKEINIKNQPS